MFELKKHFYLESSRRLPLLPSEHPCSKWHGHSFKVTISIVGELNPMGWVIDYADIDAACADTMTKLDHGCLNDHMQNPTTEALCKFIYDKIKPSLGNLKSVEISETRDCSCKYPAE